MYQCSWQNGLRGCGLSTALGLAHAGYGSMLVEGIAMSDDMVAFLTMWREALVRELRTNQSGLLPKRCPRLAQSVPSEFPDVDLVKLYLNPLTSHNIANTAINATPERRADVVHLAKFAEDNFVWGDFAGILKQFSMTVFPGLALRELVYAAQEGDVGLARKPIVMMGKVHGVRQPSGSSALRAPEIRASLLVNHMMVEKIRRALAGRHGRAEVTVAENWLQHTLPHLRVWLPLAIVNHVVPGQLSAQ
jgi:hypothetical protein